MTGGEKTFMTGGSIRAPTKATLCERTVEAWDEIRTEIIVQSFKKCWISNGLHGTDAFSWNGMDDGDMEAYDDEDVDDQYNAILQEEDWNELFYSEGDEEKDVYGFQYTSSAKSSAILCC